MRGGSERPRQPKVLTLSATPLPPTPIQSTWTKLQSKTWLYVIFLGVTEVAQFQGSNEKYVCFKLQTNKIKVGEKLIYKSEGGKIFRNTDGVRYQENPQFGFKLQTFTLDLS